MMMTEEHGLTDRDLKTQRMIVEEKPLSDTRLDIIAKHIERNMGYDVQV